MSGRYYRRRYGNWYRGGRYYGRRRYYSRNSTTRRAFGNMRAAKQQADQATFTLNVPSEISAFLKKSTEDAETAFGVYPLNIFELLRKSSYYQNYANMYDEFKIDRIKVKLLPTEFQYTATAGQNGTGTYRNVTVYTAWDRTGLSKDQIQINLTGVDNTTDEIGDIGQGATMPNAGLYCTIGEDITSYSSAESRIVNPGSNTTIVRYLNPKTMDEKSQWVSTSLLRQWYKGYDKTNGRFYGLTSGYTAEGGLRIFDGNIETSQEVNFENNNTAEGYLVVNRLGELNSDNPCYLIEDNGFKFKPTLLVGVYPAVVGEQTNICTFNVETEIVCTFRGLRKAQVVKA